MQNMAIDFFSLLLLGLKPLDHHDFIKKEEKKMKFRPIALEYSNSVKLGSEQKLDFIGKGF